MAKKKPELAGLTRQARHFERAVKAAKTPAERERAGRLLGGVLAQKRKLAGGKKKP